LARRFIQLANGRRRPCRSVAECQQRPEYRITNVSLGRHTMSPSRTLHRRHLEIHGLPKSGDAGGSRATAGCFKSGFLDTKAGLRKDPATQRSHKSSITQSKSEFQERSSSLLTSKSVSMTSIRVIQLVSEAGVFPSEEQFSGRPHLFRICPCIVDSHQTRRLRLRRMASHYPVARLHICLTILQSSRRANNSLV
jgi:hypothetical protein